jgi:SAM-dependent methyltransferase
MRLHVPDELQRNNKLVAALGHEATGHAVLALIAQRAGLPSLANTDILDVGCGVRFTQAIVNRDVPVKSYTGVDVEPRVIDFLTREVAARDPRFRYAHWNVRNAKYRPDGVPLDETSTLPVTGLFDLIVLYSVFTHLAESDARAMLAVLRRSIRPGGTLFFTASVHDAVERFEDGDPEHPLLLARFGRRFFRSLVEGAGWAIEAEYERDPSVPVQQHFVCRPARTRSV